jgi:hypothetical protein
MEFGGKNTQDPAQNKGSGEHGLRPVMRALASEPRRSFAIRALALPDSIVLAGKTGGDFFPAIRWASCSAPYPLELFYRLPAVTLGTPTAEKIDNRSIVNLLSTVLSSICCAKLAHGCAHISRFISTT